VRAAARPTRQVRAARPPARLLAWKAAALCLDVHSEHAQQALRTHNEEAHKPNGNPMETGRKLMQTVLHTLLQTVPIMHTI